MHFIKIDWPSQGSSMNSRGHWRQRAAIQKAMKHEAAILCRHLAPCTVAGDLPVKIIFMPPDNRRRDADNLLSSIKTALDAIAKQIGVDDSRFWPITLEKVKGDEVGVKIYIEYY